MQSIDALEDFKKHFYDSTHQSLGGATAGNAAFLGYRKLNTEQMLWCDTVFELDPIVRTVIDICMNGLLGGGIIFSRKGMKLDTYASNFYDRIWTEWVRDLVTDLFKYGIAVSTILPHAQFIGLPKVVPMQSVDVYMRQDLFGRRAYLVYPRLNECVALGMDMKANIPFDGFDSTPIQNVRIFEDTTPSINGDIRSRVFALANDKAYERWMEQCAMMAARRNCIPFMVVQDRTTVSTAGLPDSVKDPSDEMIQGSVAVVDTSYQSICNRIPSLETRQMAAALNASNGDTSVLMRPYDSRPILSTPPLVHALDSSKMMGGAMPMSIFPPDLVHLRQSIEQRVGCIFGVPRSMFCDDTSYRAGAVNENRATFMEMQRRLRSLVVPMAEEVYYVIYAESHIAEYVAQTFPETDGSLPEAIRVGITLPGIPPLLDITSLHDKGILKYEYYCSYLSKCFGIPIEQFHETPKLSLHEINNITLPASAGGAAQQDVRQ